MTKYKTNSDLNSIDHGKLGVEVLKKDDYIKQYTQDEKHINLILKAVGQHNLYKIDENLDLDEEIICKIIRDADKLDLLETQGNMLETNEKFHKEIIENIYKKQCCLLSQIDNETDHIIIQICFIYDINFQYSLKYIKDKDILKHKLELIKNNTPEDVDLKEIETELNEYLNTRIKL